MDGQGHYVGLAQPLRKWQDWEYREWTPEWDNQGGRRWVYSIWGPYSYRRYFQWAPGLFCRFATVDARVEGGVGGELEPESEPCVSGP